jgi:hypothetical protein
MRQHRMGLGVLLFSMLCASAQSQTWPARPEGLDDAGWVSLQQSVAQTVARQSKLSGDGSRAGADGASGDRFGSSIAVFGDTALIGSARDDHRNIDEGSAYVFVRVGNSWNLQAKLIAGDGSPSDGFGGAVALGADTALIGANFDDVGANSNQGSAYVFVRSGSTWSQQAQLTASDGAGGDVFGGSVALDGDTALVGASQDDASAVDQGSAYVFVRSGTTWSQQAKLTAADGAAADRFGASVALSDHTALIGADLDDVGASNQGSAYVFVRSGNSWTQQAKLSASDGAANDVFGNAVALAGDTALVGATFDDIGPSNAQGSAYVFTRSGSSWTEQAMLTASDGNADDAFGWSVALSGDTALIGAITDNLIGSNEGSAYIFTRSGSTWSQQSKLTASDAANNERFGSAVALFGQVAMIGAALDRINTNSEQGSVYVLTQSGNSWSDEIKVTAGEGAAFNQFGYSVAVSGDTVLVGVRGDDIGPSFDRGSVFVYTRSGDIWIQQAQLTASDGATQDQFGFSIAFSGNTALIGAPGDQFAGEDQGAAYVFVRSGSIWSEQAKLTASDGAVNDQFGFAVALSGDRALVGAPLDNEVGVDQGSSYVFIRSGVAWSQEAKLIASDGAANDQFGTSVALAGDTALIGAPTDDVGVDVDAGSAYVFVRGGTSWGEQSQVRAIDRAGNDQFGRSVTLSGDTALIGAHLDDVGAVDQGSAYVYVRDGSTWIAHSKLTASDGAANDWFGFRLALSGDIAVIGARSDDVGAVDQGSAYTFFRNNNTWFPGSQLTAADGAVMDLFGFSVALSETTAVLGAPLHNGTAPFGNPDEGAAYVFTDLPILFSDSFEATASPPVTSIRQSR